MICSRLCMLCLIVYVFTPLAAASAQETAPPALLVNSGLNKDERLVFYHLAEGSEIFPLKWLMALESARTGRSFMENLGRFGLIDNELNPGGLPVGLTAEQTRDLRFSNVRMVGVNCAACHVGQLEYRGARLRVDGGPGRFDIESFYAELAESAARTIRNPARFVAFMKRYAKLPKDPNPIPNLADALQLAETTAERFEQTPDFESLKRSSNTTDRRLAEAVELLAEEATKPEHAGDSPSGRPYSLRSEPGGSEELDSVNWSDSQLEARIKDKFARLKDRFLGHVQGPAAGGDQERAVLEDTFTTFRLISNRVSFIRNLNQSKKAGGTPDGFGRTDAFARLRVVLLGKKHVHSHTAPVDYPHLWGMGEARWLHWDGNTNAAMERNIGQALGLGASFSDSKFDSSVRVRNLHTLETLARKVQPPAWPETMFGKLDHDRVRRGRELYALRCANCHQPEAVAGAKRTEYRLFDLKEIGTDPNRIQNFLRKVDGQPFSAVIAEVLGKIKRKAYQAEQPAVDAMREFDWDDRMEKPEWRTTSQYTARPLTGVWATAPYLHNGSVPSLYDLLLPAKDRPVKFATGHREYDPVKVGYVQHVEKPASVFDTKLDGNSNRGHEFGTDLSESDRASLLECLKSL